MQDIVGKFHKVYNLLADEHSRSLFQDRIKVLCAYEKLQEREESSAKLLFDFYENSKIDRLEKYRDKSICIAGAGYEGRKLLRAMRHANYKVCCFIDNDSNKIGKTVDGISVYSFVDICIMNKKPIVVVSNPLYGMGFLFELREYKYPDELICFIENGYYFSTFGNEYFDVVPHLNGQREIFVDAGCFDGGTTIDFIDWCNGEYDIVYAFEPILDSFKLAKNNLLNKKNVFVLNQALGAESGEVAFSENIFHPESSRALKEGDYTVEMNSIDNVLKGGKATFIKMDIEGAELDAITGARNTIQKYHPLLAISVYHNEMDIVDIPLYIHELVPEYYFYLRHYTTTPASLVLYAVTKKVES